MIPRSIHQTARDKALSWEEERLAARLRRLLPGWTYRVWDDADNLALMRSAFPHRVDAYLRLPFGVMRADVARYAILHAHGGWYFDTDYKLRRPIGDDLMAAACVIPLEYDEGDVRAETGRAAGIGLGNSVMGSAAGHPFWAALIDDIFARIGAGAAGGEAAVVPATGPEAATRFLLANRDSFPDIVLPPRNLFHPRLSLLAMRTSADADTYGAHLCWGSWRGRPLPVAARKWARRKLNAL